MRLILDNIPMVNHFVSLGLLADEKYSANQPQVNQSEGAKTTIHSCEYCEWVLRYTLQITNLGILFQLQ